MQFIYGIRLPQLFIFSPKKRISSISIIGLNVVLFFLKCFWLQGIKKCKELGQQVLFPKQQKLIPNFGICYIIYGILQSIPMARMLHDTVWIY